MVRYKPYERYKDSGVEWIGEIPEQWTLYPVKRLLRSGRQGIRVGPFGSSLKLEEMDERFPYKVYGQENVISGDFLRGTRFISRKKFSEMEDYRLEPGDIIISMMGTIGCCKVVPAGIQPGIMDSHLIRIRAKSSIVNPLFLEYVVDQAHYVQEQLVVASKGTIMSGLNSSIIKTVFVAIPTVEEQQAIVNFLDHKTTEIDNLIADKEKLISLLQEYRQSVISEAVTKGLDPDVKMKDSGIEWIGEIPEHWMLSQIGKHYDICLGKMLQPTQLSDTDSLVNYLCSINIGPNGIDLGTVKEMWFSIKDRSRYEIKAGDLLVCEGGDVGKAAIWDGSITPCYIQNALHRIRPADKNSNRFLKYWFKFIKESGYIDMICNKATMAHYTREKVAHSLLLLAPPNEQHAIADYLDQKTSEIDTLNSEIQDSIEQLKEYRQSLISEAVTGKIDVRGFTAEGGAVSGEDAERFN